MPTLEPALALATCETALRQLLTFVFSNEFGATWLEEVTTPEQRKQWPSRALDEERARGPKGVLVVPDSGLSYANFYDLISLAEKHWQILAPALGKKSSTFPLLKRFDSLRNSVGHSRPLLQFEKDLLSGIAGQIRNQVTNFMSSQDEVGDIYPRIESISESFGRRVECSQVVGEIAGTASTPKVVVHPGDHVTFECQGVDPQDRELRWQVRRWYQGPDYVIGQSGAPAILRWEFTDQHVSETLTLEILMTTHETPYHRFGGFDHRALFYYTVRPPIATPAPMSL